MWLGTRSIYDAWKLNGSPGVRRTQELRQLASEGVLVVFESRWKVKVVVPCVFGRMVAAG